MATEDFPVERIHNVALGSALFWLTVSLCTHFCTPLLWRDYSKLSSKDKLNYSNRVTSAVHALLLIWAQIPSLRDEHLLADPLHAVTERHFYWSSVIYGYLLYDLLYLLVFYKAVGGASFIFHHALALLCACVGIYLNRMAFFGAVIQVFFEATTPLLHALGCMKIMGLDDTLAYVISGLTFAVEYLICRVIIGNYYWWVMIRAVIETPSPSAWDWGGVLLYGMLSILNLVWFRRIIRMILRKFASSKVKPAAAPSEAAAEISLRGEAPTEGRNAADAHVALLGTREAAAQNGEAAKPTEPENPRGDNPRQRSASSRGARTGSSSQQQGRSGTGTGGSRMRALSPDRMKRLEEAAAAHGFKVSGLIVNPTLEDLRKKGLL